jgi:hypothetical protein
MNEQDKDDKQKLASKVFENSDFGYYKVNIERPKRLKSQLRDDLIETLRYDKSLIEPMTWAYKEFGGEVYIDITKFEKEILEWCEKEEINLNINIQIGAFRMNNEFLKRLRKVHLSEVTYYPYEIKNKEARYKDEKELIDYVRGLL